MEEQKEIQTQEVQKQVDIQQILDERAKALGFESWEDMEARILEEKGRLYELLEKTKKEAEEREKKYRQEIEKYQQEIERLKKEYEDAIVQAEIKSRLTGRVVDVEKAFRLLKAEKTFSVQNGKVLVDGEELTQAIEKFLQENPFLVKASEGGAGITPAPPKELSPEEKVKEAIKKLIGGK